MSQLFLDKDTLIENLFIRACVPTIRRLIKKMVNQTCNGCHGEVFQPNQLAHECLEDEDVKVMRCTFQAVCLLDLKRHQIFQQMTKIAVLEKPEIAVVDILEFFGAREGDPFKRISWDRIWQNKLQAEVFKEIGREEEPVPKLRRQDRVTSFTDFLKFHEEEDAD